MLEPEAAVAIVHTRTAPESVLLIRRAERQDDPWSGHWSFPGGRRGLDDADLVHTALRELAEECGVHLGPELLAARLPAMVAMRSARPYILVAPFVFRTESELPAVPDPREAVEARWVPLSTLRDPARHCLQCVPGRPTAMLYPAIALHGTPLWGFTYRLMADWLSLGPEPHAAGEAGLAAANRVLEFLVAQEVPLVHGWTPAGARRGAYGPVRTAAVKGRIPDAAVLARFSAPGGGIPPLNLLEARPESVRIVGLDFDEYLIESVK